MEIKQSTLKNGLRIITAERPQIETVSLGVWVNTGAAAESEADNGISHFIEHMVFKGTKKRNSLQISEDIENVGGATNAYTSRHFTCFYAKMLKDDLELATDVICDFITDPTFDAAEMSKEKEVVVQEIKQSADAPDDLVFDYFQEAAFPNQASGRTILGTPEHVRGFNKERMLNYMRTHYTADNMVAAAVGRVDHDKFVKMVEERMNTLPAHADFDEDPQYYVGGGRVECKDIEQTHLVLGFKGASYMDEDYYNYSVLSTIFGGGMSSRLFQSIRERSGLCYSIYTFTTPHQDTGLMSIYTGLGEETERRALERILQELHQFCEDGPAQDEISRTREQAKTTLLMGLESTGTRMMTIGRSELIRGEVSRIEDVLAGYDSVTRDDILELARRIFDPAQASLAVVGNPGAEDEYRELLSKHL